MRDGRRAARFCASGKPDTLRQVNTTAVAAMAHQP